MIGVPIRWQDDISTEPRPFVSCDSDRKAKPQWLHVRAEDYLMRGRCEEGLDGKLKQYLRHEGVDPSKYTDVYLVTAPRFLRYSFNPASFWYLYTADKHLNAMIVEVNNTFGERRLYFLPQESNAGEPNDIQQLKRTGSPSSASFHYAWAKDFHVSPFSSRKGGYHVRVKDPCDPQWRLNSNAVIDNAITLTTSKGRTKLVARVQSVGKPIDPATMASYDRLWFIMAWWWVGLMTFPRIITEAFKLYFHHKLHVWYRPEVNTNSIGRSPTPSERALEAQFARILAQSIESYNEPLKVLYTPPGDPDLASSGPDRTRVFLSHAAEAEPSECKTLNLHVTTPAFFSRLVQYQSLFKGLESETQNPAKENHTAQVSDLTQLYSILAGACRHKNSRDATNNLTSSLTTRSIVTALRILITDHPKVAPSYPIVRGDGAVALTPYGEAPSGERKQSREPSDQKSLKSDQLATEHIERQDNSHLPLSFVDLLTTSSSLTGSTSAVKFRTEVLASLRILLAARFALGNESLLNIYLWLGAFLIVAFVAWAGVPWIQHLPKSLPKALDLAKWLDDCSDVHATPNM